jgi:hypothetical protein
MIAIALVLVGCASAPRPSGEQSCADPAWLAEIAFHEQERHRYSAWFSTLQDDLSAAEEELANATTDAEKEDLREKIAAIENEMRIPYTEADLHLFAAQQLADECPTQSARGQPPPQLRGRMPPGPAPLR